jgi:hypothetical protein
MSIESYTDFAPANRYPKRVTWPDQLLDNRLLAEPGRSRQLNRLPGLKKHYCHDRPLPTQAV